ncbi:MAG: class I SAM-dependent methyltransferase [Verrucomicrobia bacterium]|nr:class I SAM-dependent methyltransferase [Verrucomicrobiota bacterium]MBU1733940.1 class I SAM-dependent methyltransferase [Verrucomicrobiota bacterium]MBU1857294.1 class I SAM-dependent methyltransferase [Verrucomicrobiota bacterium]
MRISRQEVFDNHSRLMERNAFYRRCGYDSDRSTAFILAQALPLPGRILEIGTGKGRFLMALLSHVSRVTTIDIDPAEQRCARLNVAYAKPPGRARFMIANAENLPWPDHSFDSVVSVNALHHMKNIPHVIGEVLRIARPAGKIVLADFNTRGFSIMNNIHREEGRIHECIPYRFKDLVKRFTAHGWTAVLRSDYCQAVLIAVKASGGGKNRRGLRILKGSLDRTNNV